MDMIDFEVICSGACGALAVLLLVQCFDIGDRKSAAVIGDARAPSVNASPAKGADAVHIVRTPFSMGSLGFLKIALTPFLGCLAMTSRVFGSAFFRPFGTKPGIFRVVTLTLGGVANNTKSVAHVAVGHVSLGARVASVVARGSSLFGSKPQRVPRLLRHGPHAGFAGTLSAPVGHNVPLGNMPLTARFSRKVEALTGRDGGKSFGRRGWHSPTTLTATTA